MIMINNSSIVDWKNVPFVLNKHTKCAVQFVRHQVEMRMVSFILLEHPIKCKVQ